MNITNTVTYFPERKNTPGFCRIKQFKVCHEISPVKFSIFKAVKHHTWLMLHGSSTSLTATVRYYPALNYSSDKTKSYKTSTFISSVLYSSLYFNLFFLVGLIQFSSHQLIYFALKYFKNATLNVTMKIKSGESW